MTSLPLPLLDVFLELQRRGFALGLPDYLLALEALAQGFGLGSREELAFMCRTLWAKSLEEQEQVTDVLDAVLPKKLTEDEIEQLFFPEDILNQLQQTQDLNKASQGLSTATQTETQTNSAIDSAFSLGQAPRNVGISVPVGQTRQRNHDFDLIGNLPVTKRQMKRAWRYYRRMQRVGSPVELDVLATIEQMHRQGILVKPVLVPRRCNLAHMLILQDQGGSMVPFRRITQPLLDSLKYSGLAKVSILFFHNIPTDSLYSDPSLNLPQSLEKIMRHLTESGVLIISDGGAARGNYNQHRVKQTLRFVELLKRFTPNIAWVNPVPEVRWASTTADAIHQKCMVPMFTLDRPGLDAAINVLRGRVS
ncbi:hypothetical protein SD81_007025 [Tolypothrix campylonemoides VB511288]|nr:hypothetical protein SD81_007025 [Tolypothrix campylonemoides VB511288]